MRLQVATIFISLCGVALSAPAPAPASRVQTGKRTLPFPFPGEGSEEPEPSVPFPSFPWPTDSGDLPESTGFAGLSPAQPTGTGESCEASLLDRLSELRDELSGQFGEDGESVLSDENIGSSKL